MSKDTMICAGIDTGKHKLDVALTTGPTLQVNNTAEGHDALLTWLRQHAVERVGIEASGGYEQAVVSRLRREGVLVVVFQPMQVRAYAGFHLRWAKNDRIDAALIAECTQVRRKIHAAPDPRLVELAGALTLIEQIEEDVTRFKTRRETCRDPGRRQFWEEEIKRSQGLVRRELKALNAAIRQHQDLALRLKLIESVDGIGNRTALAILIRMPEIGRLSREEVAALAGLAPFDHDSGTHSGDRHIVGGRERLRTSVYAASLAASTRWNRELIAFYRRLSATKKHKVALVACARKLLIFANTVVARGTPWVSTTAAPAGG